MNAGSRPLVTIVVPVLNGARFIRESLDSILAQSYPRIDVIVMDDASSDDTAAIVASYGDQVRYVRQASTSGIFANANDGIQLAGGDLVAIYHADDIYGPDMVEREVRCFEQHPDVGAVFCSDIFVDEAGREYARLRLPPEIRGGQPLSFGEVFNGLLRHKNTFLRCPSAMVRASTYRSVGLYRQDLFRNMADLDMWIRIASVGPIVVLGEPLYRYRHFAEQDSKRYHRLRTSAENYFAVMDHHLANGARAAATAQALGDYEAHRSQDWLMVAVAHYVLGDLPAARESLAKVRVQSLVRSRQVQRWRLALLTVGLRVFMRLPRFGPLASAFRRVRAQSKLHAQR